MSFDRPNLTSTFLRINALKEKTFQWNLLIENGLPDGSVNEWNPTLWFSQNNVAVKDDKNQIAAYLGAKFETFTHKLHTDLRF